MSHDSTPPTDRELLDATIAAIHALTVGGVSSYTINGRSVTRNDLKSLWDQRKELEVRVASASRPMLGRMGFSRR